MLKKDSPKLSPNCTPTVSISVAETVNTVLMWNNKQFIWAFVTFYTEILGNWNKTYVNILNKHICVHRKNK